MNENMKIHNFYNTSDHCHWINEISKCDWNAGKHLADLLESNKFRQLCGDASDVLLLAENDRLISFCTLAEKDEIPDTNMKPWIGFVYTFHEYRGNRYIGKLIEQACVQAAEQGYDTVYVSTDQQGLYENFGFEYTGIVKMSIYGENSRIYKRKLIKDQ